MVPRRGGRTVAKPLAKIGIALYKLWSAICNHRPADINAMTLATVDKNGKPSTRTVLLKSVDERGFIFFTNYDSRKGRELAENPNAALTFFWPELERQVCVAGTVTKLPVAESAAYFKTRPRGSQLGAWASNQSEAVPDRATLETKWRELEKKFPDEFRCRRTGADLFCGRSGLSSGRAGPAGCTTGFPTRGSRTIRGSWTPRAIICSDKSATAETTLDRPKLKFIFQAADDFEVVRLAAGRRLVDEVVLKDRPAS